MHPRDTVWARAAAVARAAAAAAGVALLVFFAVAALRAGRTTHLRQPGQRELVVWVQALGAGMKAAIREFEARSGYTVIASMYGSGMDPQKLMCGIAGGSPPDVIYQDRFAVSGWAARDAFYPLDARIAQSEVINPEDYYPAAWAEACYQGRCYAIPINCDDRALYYNKDHLVRAGFVDERGEARPPKTWRELREYAKALNVINERGEIERLGFIPNFGNSWLYLYGWQNGGRFMSPDGTRCTLDDPRIVEALQFMVDIYDDSGGVEKVDMFRAGFESAENDPFLIGKVSMKIDGNWALNTIAAYNPDLNFGVAPAPVPEGRPFITWSGGWSWAIPRGARDPDGAWEFIEWMSSMEANRLIASVDQRFVNSRGYPFIPGQNANVKINEMLAREFVERSENLTENLKQAYQVFKSLMPVAKFRPVTPVGQKLWDEHVRAFELAVHHVYTPREALQRGAAEVQEELERLLGKVEGRPLDWRWPMLIFAILFVTPPVVLLYRAQKRSAKSIFRGESLAGFLFASPWLLGFLVFTAGPIFVSIVFSFCQYDVLHPPRFVGLKNYADLLTVHISTNGSWWPGNWTISAEQPLFWKSLYNTMVMMIGIPISMAAGLGVALLLNMKVRGMSLYRTAYYLPAIVPMVASSILWLWVLNPTSGLLNSIAEVLHLPQLPWLTDPRYSKASLIIMGLWGAGAGMIIWLAGLQGIPETLYEAAKIDGAGPWARFWSVTVPMLSPYIFFNLIMGIIGTMQIFTQAYIITQGGPVDSTLFYVYNLFNYAFRYFHMGQASAMAWILFLIILALTLIQLKVAPRWVHYEVGEQ